MPRAEPACYLGLDVGGTKIAAAAVRFPSGQIVARRVVPTRPERGGQAVLAAALALAEALAAESAGLGAPIAGIGLGLCELVDRHGSITSAHTIDWRDLPVQASFARLAPAVIESDVRAAALAEAVLGAGRPYELFVYVTAGTGISSCLVQGGRPFAGARGNALVMASSPLTTICTVCGTTLRPVLEDIASGPALVARYNAAGGRAESGHDVLAAAEVGDPEAVRVVRSAGEAFGASLGLVVNVLDPEAVVVGGGLGTAGGLYWSALVESTRRHIWSDVTRAVPIINAGLGVYAGVIGAAASAWQAQRIEA